MSNVLFKPHIGKNYSKQNLKIMVLGDSHYKGNLDINDPDFNIQDVTHYVFESIFDGSKPQPAYTKTKKFLVGDENASDDFWQDIIFYNYIQGFVGDNSDSLECLTQEMIEQSKLALFEVLTKYKPDFVVIWGKDKKRMGGKWLPDEPYKWIDETLLLWKYNQFPNTIFWNIQHPSGGRPSESWEKLHADYQKVKKYL